MAMVTTIMGMHIPKRIINKLSGLVAQGLVSLLPYVGRNEDRGIYEIFAKKFLLYRRIGNI